MTNTMARDIRSRYALKNLRKYVSDQTDLFLNTAISGTEDEREKSARIQQQRRKQLQEAHAGALVDKRGVKQFYKEILLGSRTIGVDDDQKLILDEATLNYVFDWDDPPTYVKFLGILYTLIPEYGRGSFDHIIRHYQFNKLRPVAKFRDDDKQLGLLVTNEDIDYVHEDMKTYYSDELKLDIVIQCIYEELKGNGCVDELLYQDIEDVSCGVSGLPSPVIPDHLIGKGYPMSYESVWIKYKGLSMHLRFLSLESFENLRRVVDQSVSYEQRGPFSENEGFKLGYGKGGSRRSAFKFPFSESDGVWFRQFTAKDKSNYDLCVGHNRDIKGVEMLNKVEEILINGGANIPICGGQNAGKTTKLTALGEYIKQVYNIRINESEFEARYRWRYPEKNIFTTQTGVGSITAEAAYEASLRTTGDVYVLSEIRSDKMFENAIRTTFRGGRCIHFTYHPNTPQALAIEGANSLIRLGLFNTLSDALYTVLKALHVAIYIGVDENEDRYYNIYEYRPRKIGIDNSFLNYKGQERMGAFMNTVYTYFAKVAENEYFDVVPIVRYNRHTRGYELVNTVSDEFYEELMLKTFTNQDKDILEKFFRPMDFIERNKLYDITYEQAVDYYGLNGQFLDKSVLTGAIKSVPVSVLAEEEIELPGTLDAQGIDGEDTK